MFRIANPATRTAVRAASFDAGAPGPAAPTPDDVCIRLKLIGQMEAWTVTGENVLPAIRRARALLAILALAAPRPVTRAWLADLLWHGRPEEQARGSLRQEVHRLLEALAPARRDVLVVTRDQISLRPGVIWVDVEEVMRASATDPAGLALLDGDLLEGLSGLNPAFAAWLRHEQARLRDHARDVAETLLHDPDLAGANQTIHAAERLIRIDRAHEGAWRALMRAHAARGERGLAVQAYERCRAVLADSLDAVPSPATQQLLAEIRATDAHIADPPYPGEQPDVPVMPYNRNGHLHIGVRALQIVGLSRNEAHLGHGLAEEITSALSRFRWMSVVASQSVERASEIHRDDAIRDVLGVDFLLDGTIQRVRNRLRITVRLMDLRAHSQIVWARRFDRADDDILSLQDEIAAEVVAQVDPEILLIEARRATEQSPRIPSAYHLMLRAIPLIGQMEHTKFMQAGRLLQEAILQDPDYAAAHAWYAYWHIFLVGQDWGRDWGEDSAALMAEAGRLAERATTLDPYDARALAIEGHVRAFLHRQLPEAVALHERALVLNPNLAMGWALSAAAHACLGDLDEAERRARRYKQLSPMDPHAFFFDSFFVLIHLLRREHEAAVRVGRSVSALNPGFSFSCKPYLAALGHLGMEQEAASVLERLLGIEAGFTVQHFLATTPLTRDSDRQHMALGLRLAGVPGEARAPE